MIKVNLFSSMLSQDEKKYFYERSLDYAASVNGGLYLKIKNNLLNLEMHDHKRARKVIDSKEQLFESVSEWLMPCIVGLQQVYGKDYLSYLQKAAQYNAMIDKQLKTQTPEQTELHEQKLKAIWLAIEKQKAQEEKSKGVYERVSEQSRQALANAAKNAQQLEQEATKARNE